jgi:hypothetical protein
VTIGSLPPSTLVFPGHEYTLSNMEFALWVEPDNDAVKQRHAYAEGRRKALLPTIPTTLGEEKSFNPFMRVNEESVVARVSRLLNFQPAAQASEAQGVRVMDALRTLKNENAHKGK